MNINNTYQEIKAREIRERVVTYALVQTDSFSKRFPMDEFDPVGNLIWFHVSSRVGLVVWARLRSSIVQECFNSIADQFSD